MKRVLLILLVGLLAVGVAPLAAQGDSDGDGMPDTRDHCPQQAGDPANNGCPPSGFAPNPQQPQQPTPPPRNPGNPSGDAGSGSGGSGTPGDSDGDGTPDGSDACPNAGGPAHLSGCPDTTQDSDADTIPDPVDACPNVGGVVDSTGCPVFTAPTLPGDVCAVTANGNFNVNVRLTPDTDAEVLGYLLPGVVYNALGAVFVDAELWFVMSQYEGSTGTIGYAAQSVLNAAACADLFAAAAQNNLKQLGLAVHTFEPATPTPPPSHEPYGALLELACDGAFVLFQVVDSNGLEEPDSFGGECIGDDNAALPPAPLRLDPAVLERLLAEIETCTQALNHGVTVLAWARVDGVSPLQDDVVVDGRIITAENFDSALSCGTSRDDFPAGADPAAGGDHSKWILIESMSGSGVRVAGWGASMYQYAYNDPVVALCESDALSWWEIGADGAPVIGSFNFACLPLDPAVLPEGMGFGEEPLKPFVPTIVPSVGGSDMPGEAHTLNFTSIKVASTVDGLQFDLRGTEIGGTHGNDDGSTTVEYCVYVELYEVGVFNKVCYQVEVPPNCELVSTEAGVYTVVCEGEGNVSLNPDIQGLPALDVTVPPREEEVFAAYIKFDGIQGDVN